MYSVLIGSVEVFEAQRYDKGQSCLNYLQEARQSLSRLHFFKALAS